MPSSFGERHSHFLGYVESIHSQEDPICQLVISQRAYVARRCHMFAAFITLFRSPINKRQNPFRAMRDSRLLRKDSRIQSFRKFVELQNNIHYEILREKLQRYPLPLFRIMRDARNVKDDVSDGPNCSRTRLENKTHVKCVGECQPPGHVYRRGDDDDGFRGNFGG